METGNITVDPLAKVKQLRMTDLTRAGKAGSRIYGQVGVSGRAASAVGVLAPAPDSPNHLSTDDERITNHLRAGNTANRGRVLVKGELFVAGKETETEQSDAGEEGWIRDRNPKSERPDFVGSITSGGIPAAVPDSQNPLRFLIERALDEKPSKMDGNT